MVHLAEVQARFAREGVAVTALGADAREGARVDGAEAVFVGGGNTFRLLDTLQRTGLLAALRRKARSGAPYLLSPTRLYEAAMISSGGMTNRLDRLERDGVV